MASYDLTGRVALITGGAHGIGFALAQALQARGAQVAVADIAGVGPATGLLGAGALGIDADVRDPAALAAAVEQTVERFGGLDIAVANAGVAPPTRTFRTMAPADFERVLDINLDGVVNTVRAALEPVIERRGQIVVIASVYAFANGVLNIPYAMSKAAVEQFGRALRTELAPTGASASVAYFGFVDTPMVREAFKDDVARQLEHDLPRVLSRRISADQAAAAVVHGLERRAPRIIAPRRWTVLSLLRGLLGPGMDAAAEKRPALNEALRADRDAPHATHDAPSRATEGAGSH